MYIVILVTAVNVEEANTISKKLVEDKLVACVNILDQVKSIFRWEGKIDEAQEVLMIMKSRKDLFEKIVETVKSLHSYSVPEVIALPVIDGNKDYLDWIKNST